MLELEDRHVKNDPHKSEVATSLWLRFGCVQSTTPCQGLGDIGDYNILKDGDIVSVWSLVFLLRNMSLFKPSLVWNSELYDEMTKQWFQA